MSSTVLLSPESDTNESEVGRVISVLMVIFPLTTGTVLLRFVAKWKRKASFWLDDWLILGASILAAGSLWTVVESACRQELGRHAKVKGLAQIEFRKKMYAYDLLYIWAVGSTKFSILAFYWRTFGKRIRLPITVAAGVVMCNCSAISMASALQCIPVRKVWDIVADGTCIDTSILFLFNAAFNVFTNFILLVLPVPFILALQLAKSKKAIVVGVFSILGGLIIVISILRLYSLIHLDPTSPDITWNLVSPTIWSCVEMQVGIFCACVSFLRLLLTTWLSERRHQHGTHFQTQSENHGSLEKLREQHIDITDEGEGGVQSVDEENCQEGILVTREFKLSEGNEYP